MSSWPRMSAYVFEGTPLARRRMAQVCRSEWAMGGFLQRRAVRGGSLDIERHAAFDGAAAHVAAGGCREERADGFAARFRQPGS